MEDVVVTFNIPGRLVEFWQYLVSGAISGGIFWILVFLLALWMRGMWRHGPVESIRIFLFAIVFTVYWTVTESVDAFLDWREKRKNLRQS